MKKNFYLFRPAGVMCITIIATMLLCGCRSGKDGLGVPTEIAEIETVQEERINHEELLQTEEIKPEEIKEVRVATADKSTRPQDFHDLGHDDIVDSLQLHKEVGVREKDTATSLESEFICILMEQDPQFPGGQTALLKYVADHIIYPPAAKDSGIQGRVVVQFPISKTGEIGEVKVVRPLHPDLDAEAVRVIKSLPKFTPGTFNGKPVNVTVTFPVVFRLNEQ